MGFNILYDTVQPYFSYGYKTLIQPIINRENLPYAMIGITSVVLAYQFIEPDTSSPENSSSSSVSNAITAVTDTASNAITAVTDTASNAVSAVTDTASNAVSAVTDTASNVVPKTDSSNTTQVEEPKLGGSRKNKKTKKNKKRT